MIGGEAVALNSSVHEGDEDTGDRRFKPLFSKHESHETMKGAGETRGCSSSGVQGGCWARGIHIGIIHIWYLSQ